MNAAEVIKSPRKLEMSAVDRNYPWIGFEFTCVKDGQPFKMQGRVAKWALKKVKHCFTGTETGIEKIDGLSYPEWKTLSEAQLMALKEYTWQDMYRERQKLLGYWPKESSVKAAQTAQQKSAKRRTQCVFFYSEEAGKSAFINIPLHEDIDEMMVRTEASKELFIETFDLDSKWNDVITVEIDSTTRKLLPGVYYGLVGTERGENMDYEIVIVCSLIAEEDRVKDYVMELAAQKIVPHLHQFRRTFVHCPKAVTLRYQTPYRGRLADDEDEDIDSPDLGEE